MKILIIEDEKSLRDSIKQYLEYQGFVCETADNFGSGRDKVSEFTYDCIVVDIGLPDGNGLDIVSFIKEMESKAGIIIISARNALDDKLQGLELGSDDYLTKPFHLSELNARINAILRRRKLEGSKIMRFKELALDPQAQRLTVNDQPVDLTEKEYQLLEYFIVNQRRVLTKAAIAEHIWGDEYVQASDYDFIYSHIKNVRKKLMDAGSGDYIKTVYRSGYRMTDN
jgi:DNA-binding response OmpR family regulator